MAAIPRRYIDSFTKAINTISADSRKKLADALAAVDYTQDVATIRDEVIAIMDVYCGGSTDLAAQLAAEFYDGIREFELGQRMGAVAQSGRDPAATDGAVRAFAQKLVEDKTAEFITLCLERLDYETKVAAAQTVLNNGKRDSRHPRYARVPSGAETCDFCLMLASRGFVYRSEVNASHSHHGCDCRVTPSWKAREVQGYDPTTLYDQWQAAIDAEANKRAELHGTSYEEERRKIMNRYRESAKNARKRRK